MSNRSSIEVVCAEYERTLTKCQSALTNWANTRAEISGRGRDIYNYNHLRALRGDFLKLWQSLQEYKRDCDVCQVASSNETVHWVTDGGLRQQLFH